MKILFKAIATGALLLQISTVNALDKFVETPSLVALVESGELPPVESRLPEQPQLAQLRADQTVGVHGGQLRLLMGKQKDIRQIVIYGYARLVGYTPEFELKARRPCKTSKTSTGKSRGRPPTIRVGTNRGSQNR